MALPTGLLEIGLPGDASLTIRQGDTWRQRITVKSGGIAADLSVGVTATLKIKDTFGGTLLETAACTIPVGTDGVVIASLTPAETAVLTVTGTTRVRALGVWDLNLSDGTNVVTVVGGAVNLYMQVTD
jgi:hypothetical protein